uniref:Altered inheritance of mitochondria protein 24, mitochondrial n=2 Tax=Vannella robusta TaxID=1487602 RepID=A0A7S4HQX9_9EUKA|mmetsp:Transcript_14442/g.18331  ORF Transcript_14442/g.18331 Transcript_14442/m.18331 type:complete len:155 (+) Transcript_14442:222-686(+)
MKKLVGTGNAWLYYKGMDISLYRLAVGESLCIQDGRAVANYTEGIKWEAKCKTQAAGILGYLEFKGPGILGLFTEGPGIICTAETEALECRTQHVIAWTPTFAIKTNMTMSKLTFKPNARGFVIVQEPSASVSNSDFGKVASKGLSTVIDGMGE